MRPTAWLGLAALCLFAASFRVHSSNRSPKLDERGNGKGRPAAQTKDNGSPVASWRILGYGEKDSDAEEDALERARIEVAAFLRSCRPPVQWDPPRYYIEKYLVKGRIDSQDKELIEARSVQEPLGKKVAGLRVEVAPDDLKAILRTQRQWFLARLLALVVAGLTATAAYLRLDEATKGYYTNMLRAASVVLVAGVAVGLWWLAS
jgi:hypothetical protein